MLSWTGINAVYDSPLTLLNWLRQWQAPDPLIFRLHCQSGLTGNLTEHRHSGSFLRKKPRNSPSWKDFTSGLSSSGFLFQIRSFQSGVHNPVHCLKRKCPVFPSPYFYCVSQKYESAARLPYGFQFLWNRKKRSKSKPRPNEKIKVSNSCLGMNLHLINIKLIRSFMSTVIKERIISLRRHLSPTLYTQQMKFRQSVKLIVSEVGRGAMTGSHYT